MTKYRVQERQVLVYTWEVDSEDLSPGESLDDALGAIAGVPDDADCRMVSSDTSHEVIDDLPAEVYQEAVRTAEAAGVEAGIKVRLEQLRGEIRAERISYGEIAELQSLAEHIEPGDVELLEWAGVDERTAP